MHLFLLFTVRTVVLQVLLRPITVMVPDLVLICENMLMSEGFMKAKALASKFHGLYSLLQELLSKQVKFQGTAREESRQLDGASSRGYFGYPLLSWLLTL